MFARRIFTLAVVYGTCALVPLYFMEGVTGRLVPPAIGHPEFYYGFLGAALAWQGVYALCARDPVRFRPLMLVGAAAKLSWVATAAVLLLLGRVSLLVTASTLPDAVLAALFIAAFARTGTGAPGSRTGYFHEDA